MGPVLLLIHAADGLVGPVLLLKYSADGLKWAQWRSSAALPITLNGPSVAPETCCRWSQVVPVVNLCEHCLLP
jgi:hypothetical protein